MKVQLMFSRKLGGKVYPKGKHEMPDKLAKDWFFKELEKCGDAVILSPHASVDPVKPDPEKPLMSKKLEKALDADGSDEDFDEDEESDFDEDDDGDENPPASKKKKAKKGR